MGTGTGFGGLQKDGILEKTALQFYIGTDVAVVHGNGRLKTQFCAITDQGVAAEQFASGVDGRLFGDSGTIHLVTD
jgi:mannitol/fructose-specific phosphotransferase system IIA component